MTGYRIEELMACAVSRELRDGELGFIGLGTGGRAFMYAVGIPSMAIALAQHRGVDFIAQYGVKVDAQISEVPGRLSDADLLGWPCRAMIPVEDCLDMFRRGVIDWGFVSAAQIDVYGNLNSVCIGDHRRPRVRLVGPIAQADHCAHARRTMILVPHERRVFVERVDFISGVGYGRGPGHREACQLPGGGPAKVVTDLAVLGFDPQTKRMRVESLHPGVTRDHVQAHTGFRLDFAEPVGTTPPPTPEEIELIRTRIDPRGVWLKGNVR